MTKIYKGSIGISVQLLTDVVLTGATTTAIKVKKPSGTIATWGASIDGVNPKQLDYTTIAGDLDEDGDYYIQAYVVLGAQTLFSETVRTPIYGTYQ